MKSKEKSGGLPKSPTAQPGTEGRPTVHPVVLRLVVVLVSLIITCVAAEVVLMLFFRSRFATFEDERTLLYRYDRTLGWFPIPNSKDQFLASRVINVENNSEGFRAPQHVPSDKPGIIFLGDSFVWGYDVNASERFTEKLQIKHPEWSIYNFGVSGYGTDQEFLLLQKRFDEYHPRVVFLVYCTETDPQDNTSNVIIGPYYKPYFLLKENRLELQGVPVPRSPRAFLAEHPLVARSYVAQLMVRAYFSFSSPNPLHNPDPTCAIFGELQKYVTQKQALLVVGLTYPNPAVQDCLKMLNVPFIDLSTPLRYPEFGFHWTPEGHSVVCDKINEFLLAGKFMDDPKKPPAPKAN